MTIAATARIYPWARLVVNGASLEVGDHSQIDDFAFVNVGRGCTIGRFVHIASFVSVIGGGEFRIDDFSGLSAGCRVITGTDDYLGPFLTNPTVPREFTNYEISRVTIEKHVIVGTNAVIFPGVTLGEGAAIGACCVVRKSLAPWGVYAGDPPRRIAERDRAAILEKRRLFLERLEAEAIAR
jgi:galactoside O-acetyltransferase